MFHISLNLLHDDDMVGVLWVADDLHILAAVAGRHHRVRYQVRGEHFVVGVSEAAKILKVRGEYGNIFVVVEAPFLLSKFLRLFGFTASKPCQSFV